MVIIPHVLAILTFKIEDKKINTKKKITEVKVTIKF